MTIVDSSRLADGRVGIGFSDPCVGLYNGTGLPGTHTDGMKLARGVEVDMNIETSEDSEFRADDVVAESDSDQFSAGTVTLTVDGLHAAADRFISGTPAPESVTVGDKTFNLTRTGRKAVAPYVGFGFIRVYQSNGVMIYVPIILPKTKFRQAGISAKTMQKTKEYQTQQLTADIFRIVDDSADWRWIGDDYDNRDDARAVLHSLLSVPESAASPAPGG